jgi:hypothetical protein
MSDFWYWTIFGSLFLIVFSGQPRECMRIMRLLCRQKILPRHGKNSPNGFKRIGFRRLRNYE